MNSIQKNIQRLDGFQRRHKPTAFMYAVIKKYGDDQAGYQAALVTYYGFLSLFPLLLVLTTVAGIAGSRDPELGGRLVDSVSSYFPVIGESLSDSVQGLNKGGLALVIGIIFTLYGARGVADAFRNAVNHIWHVPLAKRSGFPRSLLRSTALIVGGGIGFLGASIIAGLTAAAGPGIFYRVISVVGNLLILYGVFTLVLRLSLPLKVPTKKFRIGAAVSAVGLTILQMVGSYILLNEAKTLSSYGALFATTLGLMAWIYLQVQVVMYAVVIDTVRNTHAWPRSLSGQNLTPADKRINERRELI